MKITSIILLLVVIIGGVYFLKGRSTTSTPGVTTPNTESNTISNSTGNNVQMEDGTVSNSALNASGSTNVSSVVKSFTVSGENFFFTPKTISVNKGDKVKITFKDTDGTHDLTIEGYNVATPRLSGGQDATVEFVADKSGSFTYYCSVPTHRDRGMTGTLIVK